jgi:ribose transport system permease protein
MTTHTLERIGVLNTLPRERLFVVLSRIAALIILVALLSVISPSFLTWSNFITVTRQASLQFLLAAGLTIVVLAGGIDLSIGAVLGLAACVAAYLVKAGHIGGGVMAAMAIGAAFGVLNGLLVTRVRIPAFIATYGVLWIATGFTHGFMKGDVIYNLPSGFRFIATGFISGIPVPVLIAAAVFALLALMLHRTPLGRAIYAIGGNRAAARLSGMPINRRIVTIYALSGLLAGFAALVVIARINSADATVSDDLLLPALAAVCLGGTSLFGGVGGIGGTAIASLILALVLNGMNIVGVATFWQQGVMGLIIIASVIADQLAGGLTARQR